MLMPAGMMVVTMTVVMTKDESHDWHWLQDRNSTRSGVASQPPPHKAQTSPSGAGIRMEFPRIRDGFTSIQSVSEPGWSA